MKWKPRGDGIIGIEWSGSKGSAAFFRSAKVWTERQKDGFKIEFRRLKSGAREKPHHWVYFESSLQEAKVMAEQYVREDK